jgi:hypothetical protein
MNFSVSCAILLLFIASTGPASAQSAPGSPPASAPGSAAASAPAAKPAMPPGMRRYFLVLLLRMTSYANAGSTDKIS